MPRDQQAAPRSTEGPRVGQPAPGSRLRQSKGGRPKGSKNRPKSLVPTEVADSILTILQPTLPPEQYEYLRGVVKGGQTVSTKQELDILLTILNRNLLPHLVSEMGSQCDENCGDYCLTHRARIDKDVSERIRVVKDLLTLRNTIERREEQPDDDKDLIFGIYAKRGFDPSRLARLAGIQPSGVSGDADRAGRRPDDAGAVPSPLPERPLLLSAGQQVEADRVLDGDSGRGSGLRDSEA